jgi:hypothetical protein
MPKSRGEAFGLKKNIKLIQCQILNIFLEKKFVSDGSLGPNFAREAELLAP